MNEFFSGLEHSDSFAFTINTQGDFIPVKDTEYTLFEGNIYPMVEFSNELAALNDYCYTIIQSINKELFEINDEIVDHSQNPRDYYGDFGIEATSYEIMMGLEDRRYRWEWLCDITAAHLVILLYSFLEKTLKYIYKWFVDENLISSQYKIKKPTINFWLYNILNLDDETFRNSEPHIYNVLNASRKMRNNFAHDNLEGADLNNSDYIYTDRKCKPTFKLIDLINSISIILYKIEKVIDCNTKH